MPAPLAKGLILSFSLILAAGAAVYENPQVRRWVDENRRKVALALHQLGDELAPNPSRSPQHDASAHEYDSPEAVERRRQARLEILERGRLMEERRQAGSERSQRGASFDDLVDKDGSLRKDLPVEATTTATGIHPDGDGLRHRAIEHADPFSDPANASSSAVWGAQDTPDQPLSRRSTSTLPQSPPVPPKPDAYQPHRLINIDAASSHHSEQLIDLTPTSTISSAAADLADLHSPSVHSPAEMYMSVDEWAHHQRGQSPHSTPSTISRSSTPTIENMSESSLTGSMEHASHAGTEDLDVLSEFSDGLNTPSTWTEAGSEVGEVL